MSLLAPADLQALGIGLDLSTSALQAVIDREEAEIVRQFGANYVDASTSIAESWEVRGPSVYLKRAILSVVSVTEVILVGAVSRVLLTTDYAIWPLTGRIQRLLVGAWYGDRVDVVYVPQDDTRLRQAVLAELCRISTEQSASTSSGGSVSGFGFSVGGSNKASGVSYDTQRTAALNRLVLVPQL